MSQEVYGHGIRWTELGDFMILVNQKRRTTIFLHKSSESPWELGTVKTLSIGIGTRRSYVSFTVAGFIFSGELSGDLPLYTLTAGLILNRILPEEP